MKRVITEIILLLLLSAGISAQTLSDAVSLLKEAKYAEAVDVLKKCEGTEGYKPEWYLITASAYEKQGLFEQAVDLLKQGYYRLGNQKEIVFNLANNLFALGKWEESVEFYSRAIESDSSFYQAYLNRGNAFLKEGRYEEAVSDYRNVLSLNPAHPQKIGIERMISLLTEEQRLQSEQLRLAEERKREQERRMAEMRDQAGNELSDSDRSRNLQVDNTGLEDYMFNLDIME